VLGRLAVTRAFGDFECKQLKITDEKTQKTSIRDFVLSEPEIRITTLNPQTDHFMLLASDGLWDRFSSEDAVA
jgi:serine/threonine protein phosphatase PrpC